MAIARDTFVLSMFTGKSIKCSERTNESWQPKHFAEENRMCAVHVRTKMILTRVFVLALVNARDDVRRLDVKRHWLHLIGAQTRALHSVLQVNKELMRVFLAIRNI